MDPVPPIQAAVLTSSLVYVEFLLDIFRMAFGSFHCRTLTQPTSCLVVVSQTSGIATREDGTILILICDVNQRTSVDSALPLTAGHA